MVESSVQVYKNKVHAAAFTLAEILVTLGILGIVMAMTMPSVIAEYQKKSTVTALKRNYSAISQAINLAMAEIGMNPEEFTRYASWKNKDDPASIRILEKYLHVVSTCSNPIVNCWGGGGGNPPRFLNGQELFDKDIQETLFYGMRLSSGAIVILRYAVGESSVIYVDVDGSKGYNRVGRDIFMFYLFNRSIALGEATCHASSAPASGLYPGGVGSNCLPWSYVWPLKEDLLRQSCNKEKDGSACAAVIVMDGWEIKKDYPW